MTDHFNSICHFYQPTPVDKAILLPNANFSLTLLFIFVNLSEHHKKLLLWKMEKQ